ncbi:MAG: hypothetical protein ABIU55_01460 [Ferruginibacter sp.]
MKKILLFSFCFLSIGMIAKAQEGHLKKKSFVIATKAGDVKQTPEQAEAEKVKIKNADFKKNILPTPKTDTKMSSAQSENAVDILAGEKAKKAAAKKP